jgi:hypothetical protein
MLEEKVDNKKLFFDTDDDFYRFCLIPELIVKKSEKEFNGRPIYYTDFEFTKQYLDAVNNNIKFYIKDPESRIVKNKCVSYRTHTKPVENIYFDEPIYEY